MTDRAKKLRETFRKKYGVDHPSQLPSVKEKIRLKRLAGAYKNVGKKIKKTLKEKYGDENYVNVSKIKESKLKNHGDENYNNRQKMIETNVERYGMKVSTNTQNSTINRIKNKEIGFHSKKYKQYLNKNNITNVSQLDKIKEKRKHQKIDATIKNIFFGNRLHGKVIPLFLEKEYTGSEYNKLYKFKCTICNSIFEDNLYSGNIPRCLQCYPHNKFKSKVEDEIYEYLCSILTAEIIKRHDRTILNGNEIDILIKNYNIGIECNGVIWHGEIFGKKDKKYHIEKSQIAKKKGIQLIHITDWEWLNKQDIIKSILMTCFNKNEKIFARKCKIINVNNLNKDIFLNNNHIQGSDKSSIRIGLEYKNELVGIMTFVKSRYDKKYEYELSRFCNKCGITIVGGASKMFSYFIKNFNPKSIVTYSDKRLFSGKIYENLNMIKLKDTPPNYCYFHKNNCNPISRLQFQKHKLKNVLKIFNVNLTEWENMQLNGYDRIWDCGNYKYEWK